MGRMTGFLVSAIAAASLAIIGAQVQQGEGSAAPQLDKLTKPAGFSIDVYATGVQGARSMALGSGRDALCRPAPQHDLRRH